MKRASAALVLLLFLVILVTWTAREFAAAANGAEEPSRQPVAAVQDGTPPDAGPGNPVVNGATANPAQAVDPAPPWSVLKEQMRQDTEGLEVVAGPDGQEMLHLGGRFLHMSAAARGPDGRLRIQCFTDYDALNTALGGTAPASANPHPETHEAVYY